MMMIIERFGAEVCVAEYLIRTKIYLPSRIHTLDSASPFMSFAENYFTLERTWQFRQDRMSSLKSGL